MDNQYKIFQAQILAKDPSVPRTYSVVEIPNGQKLVGVQLGNALKDQSAPLLGSIVLVLQLDAYRAYILMVLREPFTFLSTNNQYRGFIPSTGNFSQDALIGSNPIQDGEIYMEATGPASPTGQLTPGFGAHLYLGNNGSAQIESGSMGERLVIGGTSSSDDHEVLLSADNGFIESNPNEVTQIQSTYNWDTLNNIEIGNVLTNPATIVTIPLAEMTIDSLGNIELFNTTFGTGLKAGALVIDATGGVTLSSGTSGVPTATLAMTPDGMINLNSGVNGVARLNDLAVSSTTVDPIFWAFITAIQNFFTALAGFQGGSPVIQSQLGVLGATFLLQSPIVPTSATSKISTASLTVKAG
ncbi:MAG: hypothetical protein ACREBR_05600 [bacterium]